MSQAMLWDVVVGKYSGDPMLIFEGKFLLIDFLAIAAVAWFLIGGVIFLIFGGGWIAVGVFFLFLSLLLSATIIKKARSLDSMSVRANDEILEIQNGSEPPTKVPLAEIQTARLDIEGDLQVTLQDGTSLDFPPILNPCDCEKLCAHLDQNLRQHERAGEKSFEISGAPRSF